MANCLEDKSEIKRTWNVCTRVKICHWTLYFSEDKSTNVYEYDGNSINFSDINRRNPDATDRHTANNSFTLKIRAESQAIYTPSFSLSPSLRALVLGRKGGKVTLSSRISIYLSPCRTTSRALAVKTIFFERFQLSRPPPPPPPPPPRRSVIFHQ